MLKEIDKKLLKKCLAGDMEAFEKVYLLGKDSVFNLAMQYLNDADMAEDVVQEVFLKIYNNLRKFKANSSFATWAFRITVNCCYDFRKKRLKHEEHTVSEEAIDRSKMSDTKDPVFLATRRELGEAVEKAFQTLKPEDKLALVLVSLENLTYKEVASILDCSSGAAKMRVHRARTLFQKSLKLYL